MNIQTPALILSSPRTGSTMLGEYFKNGDPNIEFLLEPDNPLSSFTVPEFESYISNNSNYIAKIHYARLYKYSIPTRQYLLESPNIYKIRIQRRDVVKQTASFFIAISRSLKWLYKTDTPINDTIKINDLHIDYSIKTIQFFNAKLKHCNLNFDLDLYYEDLDFSSLEHKPYYPTPQPLNYEEIVNTIKSKL